MVMRVIRNLAVLAVCAALAGCLAWGKDADVTRTWSAQRLYASAKESMALGDYEQAIEYYEKLETRYPFGPFAQQAQLDVAYAYYKYDEPASAIAAADRFIRLHPQHPNVDYAYYLKGLVNYNQGRSLIDKVVPTDKSRRDTGAARQAFRDFEELTSHFPQSKYSADAAQRMVYLKNTLARHEVHVANYYMKRGAYLAALNRARFVVENYQTTPAVPDALAVMAKAYKVMDMDDLSQDALRVLQLNYPDHPGIAEVERTVLK
jgi:outer membrane protein assembly factor BamD